MSDTYFDDVRAKMERYIAETLPLFPEMPILLLKPIPLAAPAIACEALLSSVHGVDRSKADELLRGFLRQWDISSPPFVPGEDGAADQYRSVAQDPTQ